MGIQVVLSCLVFKSLAGICLPNCNGLGPLTQGAPDSGVQNALSLHFLLEVSAGVLAVIPCFPGSGKPREQSEDPDTLLGQLGLFVPRLSRLESISNTPSTALPCQGWQCGKGGVLTS